jgi:hypothetical protein
MPKENRGAFYSYVGIDDHSRCHLQRDGIFAASKEFVEMHPKTKGQRRQVRQQILRGSAFILSLRDKERAITAARRKLAKKHTGIRLFEVAIPFDRNQQKKRVYLRGVEGWLGVSSKNTKTPIPTGSARGEYLFVGSIPREYIREISWRT